MRGEDQFHVGVVVDDLEAALAELRAVRLPVVRHDLGAHRVTLPDGDHALEFTFAYSVTVPRLEMIRTMPGTLWEPAADSGIHHLGYWSDDVAADSAELVRRGSRPRPPAAGPTASPTGASIAAPRDRASSWSARSVKEGLEGYWASGPRLGPIQTVAAVATMAEVMRARSSSSVTYGGRV